MALTKKEIYAVKKAEYPLNLLYMIQNQLDGRKTEIDIKHLTDDMREGLEYALTLLDERGASILRMKYKEKMTTTEIVEVIGVKSVNSLADSAIHYLTKLPMIGYIIYGKEGFTQRLAVYRSKIPDVLLDKPLAEIPFKAGAQLAFGYLGVEYLRELVYLSDEMLLKVAKLAPTYASATSIFLKELNIKHPFWSLLDKKEKTYANDDPKEGELCKTITLGGKNIDIRYERFEEVDLEHPIMAEVKNFVEQPEYTKDGFAFRNDLDDACPYMIPKDGKDNRGGSCDGCAYLSDQVDFIGICGCTAKRQRGVKTPLTGKEMRVAVVGELPVAMAIIKDEYADVRFDHYESAGDMSVTRKKENIRYDIILIRSADADSLEEMTLVSKYKCNGEAVQTPVKLISDPPSYVAELELAELVVSVAKKLNK